MGTAAVVSVSRSAVGSMFIPLFNVTSYSVLHVGIPINDSKSI